MRSVMLKHSLSSCGRMSFAHPHAQPGHNLMGATVIEVRNVPEDVRPAEVLDRMQTVTLWHTHGVDWASCSPYSIIRGEC